MSQHWSSGTTWGGSVAMWLWSQQAGSTEADRLSQTGSRVTFHRTPGAFDVCFFSARQQLVLLDMFVCPTLHWQTTHIRKNALPGLNFLKNVAHLSTPSAHLDLSQPGNCCNDCSLYVILVCGLVICKLIPKSQYHLKKLSLVLYEVNTFFRVRFTLIRTVRKFGQLRLLWMMRSKIYFLVWYLALTHKFDKGWFIRVWG